MKQVFVFGLSILVAAFAFAQEGTATRPAGQAETTESTSSSSRVPVATGKYITGGVLASTLGFGIGHAVQGRYANRGWIFTATEATGLAMMAAGCNDREDEDFDGDKECNNPGLVVAGAAVVIGFHVWEIVDAWTGATPVEENQPVAFILPNPKAPGVGIAWKF